MSSPWRIPRREFLLTAGAGVLGAALPRASAGARTGTTLKPRRLVAGDTVGLINPAYATFARSDLALVTETLAVLGLIARPGEHVLDRYGYLAGTDAVRAADVNAMFADDTVSAIFAVRGGWGCNRILHLLDYDAIRAHPKLLMGYSDITSLLVAVYARCGMVTFHGPVGTSTWNQFSLGYFRRVVMEGEAVTFRNPTSPGDNLVQTRDRIDIITPGKARGVLVGGNLSVLAAMIGSPYLPSWKDVLLFLEDDNEPVYRIDRMLTQLRLAGVLQQLSGFIFGKCTNCGPGGEGYGSLTLEEVFADHIAPLRIPAFAGAMIGHIENKFTVPIGIEADMDADEGILTMRESAVK